MYFKYVRNQFFLVEKVLTLLKIYLYDYAYIHKYKQ